MHISHVKIWGFRSLQDLEVNIKNYNTFIGKNDCGKSSLLRAMEFLFDPNAAIEDADVCSFDDHDGGCFVEAVITDCWHPKAAGNELKIKRVFKDTPHELYYEGQVPRLLILRNMAAGMLNRGQLEGDTTLDAATKLFAKKEIRKICPKGRVPSSDWEELYRRIEANCHFDFEAGWLPFEGDELSKLVQVVFLRADVRGEEEVHDSGTSIFTKIGRFILGDANEEYPTIADAKAKLSEEIEKVSSKTKDGKWRIKKLNEFEAALSEEIARFDSSVVACPTIYPPRMPSLQFSLGLELNDEWAGLDRMGHGMRRSVVFAMLRANRRITESQRNEGESVLNRPLYFFLIEEPEIYLHPQAERRRINQLKELSTDPNAQVVLCTHSAIFVDLGDYTGIQRLERAERRETSVHGWIGPDLQPDDRKTLSLIHRFDPAKSAMLFADLVILVEGQCESDAIPFLAEQLNLCNADIEVEVIDCTGNQNIPVFQRVLESFGVKYVAWPDSDDADTVAKIERGRTPQYGKIVITDHDWETMNGLPRVAGRLKAYASWKHFVFDGNQPNRELERRITAAYEWKDCR